MPHARRKDSLPEGPWKPFGFHSIRHKSAAITFMSSGLNAAQVLMGHYRATATDRYTKSAGLYTDQSEILSALGDSGIGQVVEDRLKVRTTRKTGGLFSPIRACYLLAP